jgi:hypothetical protein
LGEGYYALSMSVAQQVANIYDLPVLALKSLAVGPEDA